MPKWRRYFSRIAIRLMAFNLLLVILPVAGILYLDIYEEHLIEAQERAMFQRADVIAAAVEVVGGIEGNVLRLVKRLEIGKDTRVRIVDHLGRVRADTGVSIPASKESSQARRSVLYRIGTFLVREPLRLLRAPEAIPAGDHYEMRPKLDGEEIVTALEGRRGRAKRITPTSPPAVVLYVTVPIGSDGSPPEGAVVVSTTTTGILQDLYEVRLGIFRIFLVALVLAMILSLWIATTIVRPIHRLREEAGAILDRRGRLRGGFRGSTKRDEIGDLSRALERLTSRLDAHQEFSESFASDVSHEFKNPLASIRNATEMLSEVDGAKERQRFLGVVEREVARMEHLLSTLRDVTLIDARLAGEERSPVDLSELLSRIVEGFELREPGRIRFETKLATGDGRVQASSERLVQVFENLLDNALSFSPPGGLVTVTLNREGDDLVVTVLDQGPGFPEAHQEKVFDRFFTWRPHEEENDLHAGLGLAIVRAIVDGYGGRIVLRNRPEGGAEAEVRFPPA